MLICAAAVMDIHRCRFVPYPPSAINALAFSHPSIPDKKERSPEELRLALGRTNGDIEIWNPSNGQWVQETIFRGAKDRSIENLAWTQGWNNEDGDGQNIKPDRLRLFSIGNSPSITEWDLSLGAPTRHAHGNFGDLWCFAAQPRWTSSVKDSGDKGANGLPQTSQYLAAGCSDGTVVLFTTEDNDLRFVKSLGKPPTKKPHVLSIAWRDRNTVVAGYDDSVIRVYDTRSRTIIRNMSLGKPGDGRSEIHIWAVRCLPDGSIISGDSTGQLKIWDAKSYSLVQSIQAHKADILDIATSIDGKMIITGGADQRTVAYQLFGPQKGQKGQRWAQIMHRRYHEHDVRAMAAFESKDTSMLVSGGLDTVPVVMPLQELHRQYHRSLPHLPQQPQICSSPSSRLMLTWWDREISIWHVSRPRRTDYDSEDENPDQETHQLAATLLLKGDENITSAHISTDGSLIAVATVAGVKLFQIRTQKHNGSLLCRTRQVDVPAAIANFGAKIVRFSPDTHWLVAIRLNNVAVMAKTLRTGSSKDRPRFLSQIVKLTRSTRQRDVKNCDNGLDNYLDTIRSIDFAPDSRLLAVGDLSGRIDIWLLEGYEDTTPKSDIGSGVKSRASSSSSDTDSSDDDSDEDDVVVVQGQKWIRNPAGASLPKLGSAVSILSFHPASPSSSRKSTNGNVGLHATRHNPHPFSRDLPTGEVKLIAVTIENHITEFEVLKGGLSDWSRRNPAALLPNTLQKIKDSAMACFWTGEADHDRLWLYGATWLFMLDMSQDLPDPQTVGRIGDHEVLNHVENVQRKRKRSNLDVKMSPKRNTGAGDAIRDLDAYIGTGHQLSKSKGSNPIDEELLEMLKPESSSSDDNDKPSSYKSTLALLRRKYTPDTSNDYVGVNGTSHVNGEVRNNDDSEPYAVTTSETWPKTWHTFMYRAIYGMVPVGASGYSTEDDAGENMATSGNLEMAIVERPLWELAFTPRFDGGQDWDT